MVVGPERKRGTMKDEYLWDHTELPTVIEGRFMANWVYLGEGWDGEYDPNDPDDMALLRFDTYEWGDGDWEPIDGGTYCTGMPVGTDRDTLVWVLERIVADLHACLDSPRRMLEGWSWVNPSWAEVKA